MRKTIGWVSVIILALGAIIAIASYSIVLKPNTHAPEGGYLYVETTDNYDQLIKKIEENHIVENLSSFKLLAEATDLKSKFKAGRYAIKEGESNFQLIRRIRSGNWEKVVIKLKADMSRDSLLNYLSNELQSSKEELKQAIEVAVGEENGFNTENIYCIFLCDHYFFNWASTGNQIVQRFMTEYAKYWNKERLGSAYDLDLSAEEACILATIVDGEAIHTTEMPTIAGLYLNRLKKDMKLQADPTALYVAGREGRQRVLDVDIQSSNPYNTYAHIGLPPGPIMLVDKRAVEAVLNPDSHGYIYMCAKEDGSYYHYFTSSYAEHVRNAAKYRRMLNSQGIMR